MSEKVCTFVIRKNTNYKCKIMINRINLILRAKNITAKQFAEEIGIQPSGMSHIMSGRNNPSLDFVSKVIRRYPEIDANWLLLGKGEMYASEVAARVETEPTLFSVPAPTPAVVPQPLPEPASDPIPEQETELLPMVEEEPEVQEKMPSPEVEEGRHLVKILMFYDDHTFEEYRPV